MKELLALISKLGTSITSEERVALLYLGEAVERNMPLYGTGIDSLCINSAKFVNFISRLEDAGQLSLEEIAYLTKLFFLANPPYIYYSCTITGSTTPPNMQPPWTVTATGVGNTN